MDNKAKRGERPRVESLDNLLGAKFDVLDDGFVRVIDYMGSDASIVQAARVSYGAGTKKVSEDRGLIRYLLRHRHTTPFEMCELKLHVRVPMDCWRQWIRHRTANINEYSTRYSVAIDSSQETAPEAWRLQARDNKQGSDGIFPLEKGQELTAREMQLHKLGREVYKERIEAGVAREQARKDLPLSTYTEAYWKIDLHNLLHFLELRMESNAQLEICEYANIIGHEIVKRWVPLTWEAFEDYRLGGMALSRIEAELLALLARNDMEGVRKRAEDLQWIRHADDGIKLGREAIEFAEKIQSLGFSSPW